MAPAHLAGLLPAPFCVWLGLLLPGPLLSDPLLPASRGEVARHTRKGRSHGPQTPYGLHPSLPIVDCTSFIMTTTSASIHILRHDQHQPPAEGDTDVLVLPNDADPLSATLDGVTRIDLHFPAFTDGRAYSQAYLLRRRRGFAGDIRATGDVLIDQIVQMQRSGFSSAVLQEGLDPAVAQRQLERFGEFYQADSVVQQPRFAREGQR